VQFEQSEIEEDKDAQTSDSILHMGVNDELAAVFVDSDEMKCSRVAPNGCDANEDDRALVVAVPCTNPGVSSHCSAPPRRPNSSANHLPLHGDRIWSVEASQAAADVRRCVLVVAGDWRGMVRMRIADSGELVGQWKGGSDFVYDVAIDVKACMVMGAYGRSGLSVWSFKIGESGPRKPLVVVADGPPRAMEVPLDTFNHSSAIGSIGLARDGHVAVSCSHQDEFVLVWETATGKSTRQLDIDSSDERWRTAVIGSCARGIRRKTARMLFFTSGVRPVKYSLPISSVMPKDRAIGPR
jgi:hypothetical protein